MTATYKRCPEALRDFEHLLRNLDDPDWEELTCRMSLQTYRELQTAAWSLCGALTTISRERTGFAMRMSPASRWNEVYKRDRCAIEVLERAAWEFLRIADESYLFKDDCVESAKREPELLLPLAYEVAREMEGAILQVLQEMTGWRERQPPCDQLLEMADKICAIGM